MKPENDIKKLFEKATANTNPQRDRERLQEILAAQEHTQKPENRLNLWRMIMKSRMTRYATAAVFVFAVGTGIIGIIGNGATPAWAIEQTIEALRDIEAIYISGFHYHKNGDRDDLEVWVQKRDTSMSISGKDISVSGNCRWEEKDHRLIVASEIENTTYRHNYPKNRVTVEDGLQHVILWLGHEYFENLKALSQDWKEEYGKDEETGRSCVFVTGYNEDISESWWFQFDLENKLPTRGKLWMNPKFEGEAKFYAKEIIYNPQLPEGVFEFEIPEGAEVIDQRKKRD